MIGFVPGQVVRHVKVYMAKAKWDMEKNEEGISEHLILFDPFV